MCNTALHAAWGRPRATFHMRPVDFQPWTAHARVQSANQRGVGQRDRKAGAVGSAALAGASCRRTPFRCSLHTLSLNRAAVTVWFSHKHYAH